MTLPRRVTIRARLVIGSVLVAALIFAVALGVVRAQTVAILASSNSTLALDDLTSYASEIRANPNDLVDDSGKGIMIFIKNPRGAVELNTVPASIRGQVEHRPGGNETFATAVGPTTFVVVGRVIATTAGNWTLWSARSTASSELALGRLDKVFLVAGLLLLLIFAAASWVLASAALRPVRRMRERADLLDLDDSELLPVGATRDELSDLAQTLNRFLERFRESTHREKQVISDAAHEIRTPLAALTIQLELAHDHFGDAAGLADQVIAAEKSVARLSSLTANLLALSRLDFEHPSTVMSSVDVLVSELMGSVDRARLLGQNPEVEVGFVLKGELDDASIAVSAENFGRLLDNLLSNSISAVQRRGGDARGFVEITLTGTESQLILVVSDSGTGMDPQFIPRAFERFSRPDDARSAGAGGSGLGLALVQAIVSTAQGTITVQNNERGLDMTLTFSKM